MKFNRPQTLLYLVIMLLLCFLTKGVCFTTLGNEFMINTKPVFTMSQNSAYGMLRYPFSKSANLQFGYMYIARQEGENLHRVLFFRTRKFNS